MRRAVAVTSIVLGAVLIVAPIGSSLFSRSKSAQALADGVRPAMTKKALVSDRQGLEVFRAAITEFNGADRARYARALGQSPQQFSAFLQKRFPDVASGARELPLGYIPHADSVLTALEKNRVRYETADSFPISGVSAKVAPWILIAAGAGFVLVGLLTLPGRGRGPLVALLLLGVVPLVVALAASLPHKASASSDLVDALRPAFSERSTSRVPVEIATAQKFDTQLESGLLPALAQKQDLSPKRLDAFLKRESPAVASALPQFKPILTGFAALGTALRNDRHLYTETAKIPIRTLVWLMIAIGCLLALGSALVLAGGAREPRTSLG
jgi:hypothetical protein